MESGAPADAVAETARAGLLDLGAGDNVYSCKSCLAHLALADDIVSKGFYGKSGSAYLFSKVVNVTSGDKEDRMLITGMHTISDISCAGCASIVGWKYEAAHDERQKYKEGKYILERALLLGPE